MTRTEVRSLHADKQQNGFSMTETSAAEDVFDDTYKEKDGPRPPMKLVWRNIIMMTLLHIGALYGLFLIPSASALTLAWGKYLRLFSSICPRCTTVGHQIVTECADAV